MATTRVHCKKQPFDVYCGRSSPWGNPYSHKAEPLAEHKVETREEAVAAFREYLRKRPLLVKQARRELKDKVLGCWCDPDELCHCDVWIEVLDAVHPR